jgi:NAD(P)-dependent dehydrogenase (short-subunit alcohol dehydrogenase family)
MKVAVIDGQGGGIGKLITEKLRKALGERIDIMALGTNAMATAAMLKAGANEGASGENAVCISVKKVDVILGPVSILLANSMLGEVTPRMATAIAEADAEKILIPLNRSRVIIVGLYGEPLPHLVDLTVQLLEKKLDKKRS